MDADLHDRLARVAPEVDVDAALATLPHRGHRRVALLVAAAAVVAAVAVGLATRADRRTTYVATQVAVRPLVLSATHDGIELTVTITPGEVTVGERVRADVLVRNVGSQPVMWEAGGCAIPATVHLGEIQRVPFTATWDGVRPLSDQLAMDSPVVGFEQFRPVAFADSMDWGCTADSHPLAIEPGASVPWSGVADVRVGNEPLAAPDEGHVMASFTAVDQSFDVTASGYLTLVDDPTRMATARSAAMALAADHRVGDYVGRNGTAVFTEMAWVGHGWNLTIMGVNLPANATPLELRYDPATGAVTEVK